jgi:hypothetical protein
MLTRSRQSGVTLTEMTVIAAVVALLVVLGVPAVHSFYGSFESGGSVKGLISAGLASARAIAAKEQRYAGIRFQKAYNAGDPDQLKASQYMIFIVHDPDPPPYGTDYANGFRAVEGLKPIKLPDAIGVMDSALIQENINADPTWEPSGLPELNDLTTFSIVFSPSGRLVIHDVRVWNRDGKTGNASTDDIFNSKDNVENEIATFFQDYGADGLQQELGRNSLVICDRKEFKQAYEKTQGYSDCLVRLVPIYINPYTGRMISQD